jgi:hypothetical protein
MKQKIVKARIKKEYGIRPLPRNLNTWNISVDYIRNLMNETLFLKKSDEFFNEIRGYYILNKGMYIYPETMFDFIPEQLEFNFDE